MGATIQNGKLITYEQTANGSITVAVSSGGSDTVTADRPGRILSGDFSSLPYLTIQAAADAIPKHLAGQQVTISVGSGTFASGTFSGIHDGTLYFQGTTSAATLTTGSASGTCGTGTSSTSFKKPAAAANWTVNDLRNRICKIVLNGTTYWRVISSNTIDTAIIQAISGLDNTATFAFVNVGTAVTKNSANECLIFTDCSCSIIIEAVQPNDTSVTNGIVVRRCNSVTAYGCNLSINAVSTFYGYRCNSVDVTDCSMSSAGTILLDQCQYGTAKQLVSNNGSALIRSALYAEIGLDAAGVAANAAKFVNCLYATGYRWMLQIHSRRFNWH